MKNKLKLVVSIAIAAAALWVVFQDVSFTDLQRAFVHIQWQYFALAMVLVFVSYLLKALRWQCLLAPIRHVPVSAIFQYYIAGFFGNFLPARAGEFIRAYLVTDREKIPYSAALATVVMERLVDMFCVLLLLPILFVAYGNLFDDTLQLPVEGISLTVKGILQHFGYISLVMCLAILAFSLFLHFKPDLTLRLTGFCLKPLPDFIAQKVLGIIKMFMTGLGVLGSVKHSLMTVMYSIAIWLLAIVIYIPILIACNISPDVSLFAAALLIIVFVAAFITIVPSPGFLGSFQLACTVALYNILHVAEVDAVTYGLVAWTAGFLPVIILGPILLIKLGFSFSSMERAAAASDATSAQ